MRFSSKPERLRKLKRRQLRKLTQPKKRLPLSQRRTTVKRLKP
jgi:hypothetical protein